ncbi:MAG: hypothetical protein H0U67_04300 [Gemmatimonadetes bacterium]|nr:hypothetical protein [Gemmatimonadota bacterium]
MKDTVQQIDGMFGTVVDFQTLYATVVWDDGRREEIDQFDPRVEVIQRAESE